jgi:hypothetical protein
MPISGLCASGAVRGGELCITEQVRGMDPGHLPIPALLILPHLLCGHLGDAGELPVP